MPTFPKTPFTKVRRALRSGASTRTITTLVLTLCLSACDEKAKEATRSEEATTAEQAALARQGAREGAGEKAATKREEDAGGSRLFDPEDKELRKRACEFLTADMVSKALGVPAGELKQTKVMGCIYSWNGNGETLEATLMMMRVHKTEERAKTWFENATASVTKEQLDAQMDELKKKVQDHEDVDTEVEKKTAASLTDLAKMGAPDKGVTYTDVAGIGDAARVSEADGILRVRLGNLTFQVAAFKGPEKPKAELDLKNLKGMAKQAMDLQKKWIEETIEQRKKDVARLAPEVVQAIDSGTKQ